MQYCARDPAERDNALLSAQSLWRGQALCLLDNGQLSRAMGCMPVTECCLITRVHGVVKPLSPARLPAAARNVDKMSCRILIRCATGAMLAIT